MTKILSIDVGATSIKYSIISDGHLGDVFEMPSEAYKGGSHLVDKILSIIDSMYGFSKIAISTSGQVDVKKGRVVYADSNIPNYSGTELKEIVANHTGLSDVVVDNDVNCAALGELYYGAGRDCPNFLCFTIGTGIGGAIVIDGKIYRGSHSVAGEFGNMRVIDIDGKEKVFQDIASTKALVRRVNETCLDLRCSSGRQVMEYYYTDERVRSVMDCWIEDMAKGLGNIVNIIDPQKVILGGGIMENDIISYRVDKRIRDYLCPSVVDVVVQKAELGNNAGMLGAYSLLQ